MAAPIHPSFALTIGIAVFVLWRVVSRVRRAVGRQRLSPVRPWLTIVLFPLLALLLLLTAFVNPVSQLGLLAGCGIGVALGVYGLRLTRFEATPQGLYYTPNPYLGVALSVLLIARIGWRYAQLYLSGAPADAASADFARSALTLFVFGMLAGYYTTIAAGLLRWKARAATGGAAQA
jgi:hypothetical protein